MFRKISFTFLFLVYIWSGVAISTIQAAETSNLGKLVELGLVTNKEKEDIKLSNSIKKIEGYVLFLRLKGLESKAKSYKGKATYSDLKSVKKELIPSVNYSKANPKLGWDKNHKKFEPNSKVVYQDYIGYLLSVLGYKEGTDYEKGKQMDFAVDIYLISSKDKKKAKDKLKINETHKLVLSSLKTYMKNDQLLSSYLVKKGLLKTKIVNKYDLHISNEENNLEQREIEIGEEGSQ